MYLLNLSFNQLYRPNTKAWHPAHISTQTVKGTREARQAEGLEVAGWTQKKAFFVSRCCVFLCLGFPSWACNNKRRFLKWNHACSQPQGCSSSVFCKWPIFSLQAVCLAFGSSFRPKDQAFPEENMVITMWLLLLGGQNLPKRRTRSGF